MAKQTQEKKKTAAWVNFQRDPKTGVIMLSRYDSADGCIRLQFPRWPDAPKEARLLFEGSDVNEESDGLYLAYSDVQWLAQALPELLNEMERAGITE